MTTNEVQAVIAEADLNGDGKLDYAEFCHMLSNTASQCVQANHRKWSQSLEPVQQLTKSKHWSPQSQATKKMNQGRGREKTRMYLTSPERKKQNSLRNVMDRNVKEAHYDAAAAQHPTSQLNAATLSSAPNVSSSQEPHNPEEGDSVLPRTLQDMPTSLPSVLQPHSSTGNMKKNQERSSHASSRQTDHSQDEGQSLLPNENFIKNEVGETLPSSGDTNPSSSDENPPSDKENGEKSSNEDLEKPPGDAAPPFSDTIEAQDSESGKQVGEESGDVVAPPFSGTIEAQDSESGKQVGEESGDAVTPSFADDTGAWDETGLEEKLPPLLSEDVKEGEIQAENEPCHGKGESVDVHVNSEAEVRGAEGEAPVCNSAPLSSVVTPPPRKPKNTEVSNSLCSVDVDRWGDSQPILLEWLSPLRLS
jgi:hypothetical protein